MNCLRRNVLTKLDGRREQYGRIRDREKVSEGDIYPSWDAWLPHDRAAT